MTNSNIEPEMECLGIEGQSRENHDIWGCPKCSPMTEKEASEILEAYTRPFTKEDGFDDGS